MGSPRNTFEAMAREAAARIDQVRAAGEQLTLLPEVALPEGEATSAGRSRGKATNQMRDWLASKGYRMPEEVLAQMAALATGQDPVLAAMEKAELVLAWAYDGATRKLKNGDTEPVTPGAAARMNAFQQIYAAQLRAADALLPYGAPKATPDQVVNQTVQVVVPAAPSEPRDVTPRAPRIAGRMVPADAREEIERKQALGGDDPDGSDAGSRTKGPSR